MKSSFHPAARFAAIIALVAVVSLRVGRAQTLSGLTITGNAFTYNAPDGVVSGIFLKPAGAGPFPALLLSHGKGGNANSFSLSHAQNLVRWGFVCIGPNYTHANTGSTPDDEGYSPENSRRARRALDILAATPGVDMARLAAFSHSMGSFLTIGLSGELPDRFRAVAIAAGGTSGTSNTAFAQPATQEAQPIRSPLLMFHGTVDNTVPPQQSVNLQTILQGNGVPNRRLLYQGVNHNIVDPPIRRIDAYAVMQAWFTQHGVLTVPGNTSPTIVAPLSVNVAPGAASVPIPIVIGDGESDASALTLQAFSLDSDVVAVPPAGAYTGKLPNSGLVFGGSGANRTLTITPRAGQTGTVEVALVVSEPEGIGQLSAVAFLQVNLVSSPVSTGDAHLANLATRAYVGTGGDVLIPGIAIAGSGQKRLIVRASGPALAGQGVGGTMARPQLRLYHGATEIAANIGWSSGDSTNTSALQAAFAQVGLPPFPLGSADCGLLATVNPGAYTAIVSGVSETTGVALVEVYELGTSGARLAAISCRARVGTGDDVLIPGITIAGTGAKQVIVRAAGPALAAQGVAGALAQPSLEIYGATGKMAENSGWSSAGNSAELRAAMVAAGLTPFPDGSADSAILITLGAGNYTAKVSGLNNTVGIALVEVYEVP